MKDEIHKAFMAQTKFICGLIILVPIATLLIAPLAMKAMRDKFSVGNDFYAPSHHGYKQYAVILKKNKELDKLSEITAKMEKGGWRLK